MKMTEGNRAVLIVVFIMVAFNGIFLSVNGLFMLVAPIVNHYK
jgi:TRAP-type C4-dicarboxylate transport system permease large subunit